MSTASRILKIIFILLLIVILGEVGWYFFYFNNLMGLKKLQTTTERKKESVLNERILESAKNISNIALSSSTLHNEYQGKVMKIDFKKGRFPVNKVIINETNKDYYKNGYYEYEVVLTIKREHDNDDLSFYFNREDLQKIQVFKSNNDSQLINLKDIKIGNSITIQEEIDLLNKKCQGHQCIKYIIYIN
jgi:hypothetical protein